MARIRKTREFQGRDFNCRIDAHGNLCVEGDDSEMIVAFADELGEFAAWLGQEMARYARHEEGGAFPVQEDDGA